MILKDSEERQLLDAQKEALALTQAALLDQEKQKMMQEQQMVRYCIYPKDSIYAYFRNRGLHVCLFSGMCLFLNKGRMYAYFRGSNIKILFLMFSLELLSKFNLE